MLALVEVGGWIVEVEGIAMGRAEKNGCSGLGIS